MGTVSLGEKASRVIQFMVGLKNQRVLSALGAHGFTDADVDEAWKLLHAVTSVKSARGSLTQVRAGADTIARLDAWENRWFPVAEATVARRFPAVHAELFKNLSQTTGPEVIVSVRTFIERFEAMAAGQGSYGAEGPQAKAVLETRGITSSVLDEARALYQSIGRVDTTSVATIEETNADIAKAEAELWAWYKEWTGIARVAITQRSLLKELGLASARKRRAATIEPENDDGEEEEPGAPRAPVPPPAGGPATQPTGSAPTNPIS